MLNLMLSPAQVDLIYAALAEQPYKDVAATIDAMRAQVQAQQAAQAARTKADAEELERLRADAVQRQEASVGPGAA